MLSSQRGAALPETSANWGSLSDAIQVCKHSFIGVGVFSGVTNLLMLVPAFFMLNVYDKAVGHNSTSTLWVLSIITGLMFIALAVLETVRSRILVAISTRWDRALGDSLYERTFTNAVNVGSSRASTQPLQDLNGLRQFITSNGIFAFFDAPWLPIYLLILFMFHPLLGWMGVIAALVFLSIAIANQYFTEPALAEANSRALKNNAATQRNLRNAEVAASMGMMPELRRRWRERQEELLQYQEMASNTAGMFTAITKTLRLAVQSSAIAAGAWLVLIQEISPGMIIAGSILMSRALQPVDVAVGAWSGFVSAREQYQRLSEIIEKIPLAQDKMRLPPVKGVLSARDAVIVPPGASQPAVKQVNFNIPSGSVTVISGASGAGKSTLIRGLLGLWPTAAGEIRIDGVEAASYDRAELGSQLGYLPQDIELLEGTVSSNITRFTEIDPDAVVQAARDAGVHKFILSLQNGYETEIGVPGGMLSPGQRQRIALARAIYRRPRLVVLDEPNSNLDEKGELALNQAINTLKESGSTVLIVSHRPTVLPFADYLILMADGTILDAGPVAEVVGRHQTDVGKGIAPPTTEAPGPSPDVSASSATTRS